MGFQKQEFNAETEELENIEGEDDSEDDDADMDFADDILDDEE